MSRLIRWNPFEEMASLRRDMDREFGRLGDRPSAQDYSWVPAAEGVSTKEGWTLRMALPGVETKNVHVDLDGRVLKVTGERTVEGGDTERQISEIGYGRFERSFTLPESVASGKVRARFENGMLELTLPLAETAKPRRIEIAEEAVETEQVA